MYYLVRMRSVRSPGVRIVASACAVLLGGNAASCAQPDLDDKPHQAKSEEGAGACWHSNVTTLIGSLTRQYTATCTGGGARWGEPSYLEIGFVRLVPANDGVAALAKSLEGQVVMARGRVTGTQPRGEGNGTCEEREMRSDWVMNRDSFRLFTKREGALAHMGEFTAEEIQAISPPKAQRVPTQQSGIPDQLTVDFRNPLSAPLGDLRVQWRYESGSKYGGSRPPDDDRFEMLPTGASVQASHPAEVWESWNFSSNAHKPRRHRAHQESFYVHSVRLLTSEPGVAIDLDWEVPQEVRESRLDF